MPFDTAPGNRIAYDRNGSVVLIQRSLDFGGGWIDPDPQWVRALNSEHQNGALLIGSQGVWNARSLFASTGAQSSSEIDRYAIIFPEPMAIRGILSLISYDNTSGTGYSFWSTLQETLRWSEDSTNGTDGTWQTWGAVSAQAPFYGNSTADARPGWGTRSAINHLGDSYSIPGQSVLQFYRTKYELSDIPPEGWHQTNIRRARAIRIDMGHYEVYHEVGNFLLRLHLYGEPEAQASSRQFLSAWHPSLDRRILPGQLDWGDAMRGSSSDRSFRVKNMSPTDTATAVVLTAEDGLWYPTPSPADQFLFSFDEETWTDSLTIGAIGPGTISPMIYIRRVTPSTSPLGSLSPRIAFDVGSWD